MIKRLEKFKDELSDDILWSDSVSIKEFKDMINQKRCECN